MISEIYWHYCCIAIINWNCQYWLRYLFHKAHFSFTDELTLNYCSTHSFDTTSKFVLYFILQTTFCYTILVQDTGWLLGRLYFHIILSIQFFFWNLLTQLTSAKTLWTLCWRTPYLFLGQFLIVSYIRITIISFCYLYYY